MRFGMLSLGDNMAPPDAYRPALDEAGRHQQLLRLCVAAEQLGFDLAWLGEHHLNDYILSAPEVLLGAVASRTTRIRLGTGLTLLPTLDPLLVAGQFATLDVISNGRVEFCVGRGVVPSLYREFGLDAAHSGEILEEKLELMLRLLRGETLDWSGRFRAPLHGARLRPLPSQRPHPPVWIGGGRSDHGVRLAARFGLPLMLPGIFAPPEDFAPMAQLYRELWREHGHDPALAQVGVVAHCHVRDDLADVGAFWQPYNTGYIAWAFELANGRKANRLPEFSPDGPALYGNSAEVAARIARIDRALGLDTLFVKFDGGGLPEADIMKAMETFAARVMPDVAGRERQAG